MRRVKSAPANLASMKNNKKKVSINEKKNIYFFPKNNKIDKIDKINKTNKTNNLNNLNNLNNFLTKDNYYLEIFNYNFYKSEKNIKKYSYKNYKKNKSYISNFINIFSDAINEANYFNLEEYSIVYLLSIYFSDNLLKKDKLDEIAYYILVTALRYIIMVIVHSYLLNEKLEEKIEDKKQIILSICDNIHLLN